jgi:methylthioxylose transferase
MGPAVAAVWAVLRDRRVWAVAGGGLAAALVANVSGLSEGEVERIWLPFTLWASTAVAGLTGRVRWWLAAQAACLLVVTATIGTYW